MIVPARIYIGQPNTANATLATVPSNYTFAGRSWTVKVFTVKQILLCNTTGSAATVTLNLVPVGGVVSAANEILGALSVAANTTTTQNMAQAMNVGDYLAGLQGTASAVTLTISGWFML